MASKSLYPRYQPGLKNQSDLVISIVARHKDNPRAAMVVLQRQMRLQHVPYREQDDILQRFLLDCKKHRYDQEWMSWNPGLKQYPKTLTVLASDRHCMRRPIEAVNIYLHCGHSTLSKMISVSSNIPALAAWILKHGSGNQWVFGVNNVHDRTCMHQLAMDVANLEPKYKHALANYVRDAMLHESEFNSNPSSRLAFIPLILYAAEGLGQSYAEHYLQTLMMEWRDQYLSVHQTIVAHFEESAVNPSFSGAVAAASMLHLLKNSMEQNKSDSDLRTVHESIFAENLFQRVYRQGGAQALYQASVWFCKSSNPPLLRWYLEEAVSRYQQMYDLQSPTNTPSIGSLAQVTLDSLWDFNKDPASAVWSLSVQLYRMATGQDISPELKAIWDISRDPDMFISYFERPQHVEALPNLEILS